MGADASGNGWVHFFTPNNQKGWIFATYPVGSSLVTPSNETFTWTLPTPTSTRSGSIVPLAGTSSSIGGSALTAGTCASTTVTVTGATTSMGVVVTPCDVPRRCYHLGRIRERDQHGDR